MSSADAESGADAFSHLGETVRAALSDRGFSTPTEPQRRAIPPLASGRNTLVIAPTGTGKTETAMLPVFDAIGQHREREGSTDGFCALYITPLRALNRDMRERLDWWGERLDIEIDVRHGDTTQYQRQKQANDPPDVLVTTPETLQAMLSGSKLRTALADVRHVIVDEVHELAASKRGAQLTVGLERLRLLSGAFQRIGLSATVGDPEAVAAFLTGSRVDAPESETDADRDFSVVEVDVGSRVEFSVIHPEITAEDDRLAGKLATTEEIASHVRVIREIVDDNESTLIFVNTRQTAEALGSRFKKLGEPIEVHHGSLSRDVRVDVEDRFKKGELDALVCTSSMELGIDVGRVDHVVQYGSPREVARLLQRVGRAGHRHDQVSRGTIITSHPDDTLESLAIARRAGEGLVESAGIHYGSLDVVANQIVGLVMDFGEVSGRRAYETVTRARPFHDLSEELFRAVVRELSSNRLLWLDEEADRLEKSGGTWQYYYANLSMIPDEESYEVHDMSSRTQVGTLDERFVVNFAAPGEVFIQRGEMWRINDIDEEEAKVNVAPIEDPAGEVPSWIGQEIPVPAAVANEVGELRGIAGSQFEHGAAQRAVAGDLCGRYPADAATLEPALDPIDRHVEAGFPLPTDRRICIESRGRTVRVDAAFGHEINETLGRLLSALVGQQTGSSVGMSVDPYRISFEVPQGVSAGVFRDILQSTDPDHLESYLELALKRSETLKFTLAQVAAKFGSLKRYQGRGRFGGDRLLEALEGTPVYDEAMREIFHRDLALEETADVLRRVQEGDLDLVVVGDVTPIGTTSRPSGQELLVPEKADASVIEAIEDRIHNDRVLLCCCHCKDWDHTTKVRRVREQPECPECGSTRVAALNPWADEVVSAVRADEKDDEQEKQTQRAYRAANLVQSHGKQAVIALAARGVGPHNAARIISKFREDEMEFYRDLLKQEREYARTQSFWD
ncbi:DEAD/DEAH box helicase [Halohasta litorea]|uniref:DEAD/DEAH box helicase n=1 Tax=Halohasta litorea TaxID=869891 RepID=A0ABD6D921_9EURY|nr:DEAD/DEAH box helicase [Halohasta litorea]